MDLSATPLKVLIVDDVADDAELVALALRRGGFQPQYRRVETREDMAAALAAEAWDLIIADHAMPRFSGLEALALAREQAQDLPFILVSGNIGEEVAVAAMKAGAHDYVLKQNLARLAPAVDRELREARLRQERRREEEALRLLEAVGAALAPLFDPQQALETVARLVVPTLADGSLAELYDEEKEALHSVVVVHRDPERERLAREARGRETPGASLDRAASVLSVDSFLASPAPVEAGSATCAAREVLEAMGAHSCVCVSLSARGRVLGTFTLVSSSPNRSFSQADVRLALEIARRTAFAVDNAQLYASAREAIRVRDDFLTIASHELRTPLTALRLQLQVLRKQLGPQAAAPLQDHVERAIRQTGRLASLIGSLLDVARITTGRVNLQPEPFDLAEVVEEVVGRLAEEAARAGCEVRLELDRPVEGRWDRLRLEQVLVNLLSNAFKYGPGRPVEVGLARLADDDSVRLWVRDHGIGIAPADLDRIFGRFERAVSLRSYGGLGLGLFIARETVSAHGGTIRAESAPGQGALFTVDLPRQAPATATPKETAAAPEPAPPRRATVRSAEQR